MNDIHRLSIAAVAAALLLAAAPAPALEGAMSGGGLVAPPVARKHCAAGTHQVSAPGQPLRCEQDAPPRPVCPKGAHAEATRDPGHPWACEPDQPGAVCPPGMHGVVMHRWGNPFECVADIKRNQGFSGALGAQRNPAGSAAFTGGTPKPSGSGGGRCANFGDPKCGCRPCGAGGRR
jgi:hypothetical protein